MKKAIIISILALCLVIGFAACIIVTSTSNTSTTTTPSPIPTATPTPIITATPKVTTPGWTPPPIPEFQKSRVIATTDGEIDDECSLVRFLLYANEWDVEGIITSSSQYHWQGNNWAGDDWQEPYLDAYEQVYPNLVKHDPNYPTPEYIRAQSHLGNVKSEGDMSAPTAGSQHIVQALLDDTDDRPIWLQAWGGMNTIARALKTIEEEHSERMAEVAGKCRFFFIWEQDSTYQDYIRPHWAEPYNILTIVSDQFITFGYWWEDWDFPDEIAHYFSPSWMNENLLLYHGPLLEIYKAQRNGRFRSEGDSPSFLHAIPNGLRSTESPDWGGWGGRYILVRENTWLDPVPEEWYTYPPGRWYTSSAWGRESLRNNSATQEQYLEYFKQIWRWVGVMQNDFAARADWCVTPQYVDANHKPYPMVSGELDRVVAPGDTVTLDASPSIDPDGDQLTFNWWQYHEADSADTQVMIANANSQTGASFTVPNEPGKQVHIILEVTDSGTPPLTRYQRIVFNIN